ncbi:MAG: uracil-DNA glycosylase [Alphaproteobacteria bacterium]
MVELESKNIHTLDALKAIISWYKEAGVDVLSSNKAVDHLAQIALLKQEQATYIAPTTTQNTLAQRPKVSPPKPPSMPPSIASQSQAKEALSKGRGISEHLLSESAQKAIGFVQDIQSIEELSAKLKDFNLLPIQQRAKHTFLGEGNAKAKLLIIHDAPSDQDDRTGQMLSDKEGALFDKMLASISLSRQDVFMTYSVFWRPPGGRSPTNTEIATCLPIVEKLIGLIQPSHIVTVGTAISQIFTNQTTSISRLRGRFYPLSFLSQQNYEIMPQIRPLYSPKYLLSSPALKQDAWHDLLAIKDALSQGRQS